MARKEGAKPIGSLFKIYADRLVAPQSHVIESAENVIGDILGLSLPPKTLSYQVSSRVLYIQHSVIRSAVLPHKEAVLRALKKELGDRSCPKDII